MRFPVLPGYRYEAFLGEDPFGWAFVASHESGARRTVRVYKAQATSDRILYPFFKTLSAPGGPPAGLAPVHDYVLQDASGHSACATPFYGWKGREDGLWQVGSLSQVMGMLSREQAIRIVRDLAVSLGALHETDLFHGGLRPSGIYLAADAEGGQRAVISDFGQIFMGGLQYLEAGEPLFYAAPEQLARGDFNAGRGKRWDVYSFGAVAYELLAGQLPRFEEWRRYAGEHPEWLSSTAAITFGEISEVTGSFVSQLESEGNSDLPWPGAAADRCEAALRETISACLRCVPEERPATMAEVAAAVLAAISEVPAAETPVAEPTPAKVVKTPAKAAKTKRNQVETPAVASGVFEGVFGMEPAPRERGFSFRRFPDELRANPVLRWQVAAIGFATVTLVLTYFAFFNYLGTRKEKDYVVSELLESERKLQLKDHQQAEINRKIREEQLEKNQLISELNESEDSKNNLLGQTKLARQLLRETQENGDRFFRLVLDNRDSDVPEFRAGRATALEEGRRHYERLVETYGDAPDFIVSTADALFYLGRIYKEKGEFEKALTTFGEAERRYSSLLENDGTSKVEFVRNIAHSKSALGELAIRSGEHSTARHYFTESSRFWNEARSRDRSIATEASLHIHENSLAIVECELAMDRLEAAIDAAMSVGVLLTEMEKAAPGNHRIVGALAKSFALSARVLEARRENELARTAYQQASDLYAKAVRLDAAVDEYQLGLGNSLARVGLLSNDTTKLEGAAEVLGRVVAANPYESAYLKTLADIYGALSVGQRDGGRLKNAVALEEKAISILRPIVGGNRSVAPDVKYSYSQRLAHLAELLGDSGKFDASRAPLKEAITLLEGIADGQNSASEYRRTLARTRGLAGFACMKSGDPGEAKEHLRLAKTEWQSYMAANPDDTAAAQAVKWTSEQLGKLP